MSREVLNIRINENGVILNTTEASSYVEKMNPDLNTKEYVANLIQYFMFNDKIKNNRELLVSCNEKLKDCITLEISSDMEPVEIHASVFSEDIVKSR